MPIHEISDDDGDDIDECEDVMHRVSVDNFVCPYQNKEKENSHFCGLHTIPGNSSGQNKLQRSCSSETKYDGDEHNMWSRVFEESEELLLHENARNSFSHSRCMGLNNFHKDSKRKSKLRFSFHQSSCKKEASFPLDGKSANAVSSGVCELHSGLKDLDQRSTSHSMAERLEGIWEQDVSLQPFDMPLAVNKKRAQLLGKRILASSVNGLKENGHVPEFPDDGISSEDEVAESLSHYNPTSSFAMAPMKEKTMADHFMDIFDSTAMNGDVSVIPNNRQKSFGYFGRLQQIMHGKKERQMNFLKQVEDVANFQEEKKSSGPFLQPVIVFTDEMKFFDVEIVSRYLEAKLTVCCCLPTRKAQSSQHMKGLHDIVVDGEMENQTIVFNSTMCNTVELEIGKLIRVHAPWEEVPVADERIVFLCMYFSDILT